MGCLLNGGYHNKKAAMMGLHFNVWAFFIGPSQEKESRKGPRHANPGERRGIENNSAQQMRPLHALSLQRPKSNQPITYVFFDFVKGRTHQRHGPLQTLSLAICLFCLF